MKIEGFDSVWDAITDMPEEAASLSLRSSIMRQITGIIKENNWEPSEAARRCRVTIPRMDDMLHGRISRFSLDDLISVAASLGWRMQITLEI